MLVALCRTIHIASLALNEKMEDDTHMGRRTKYNTPFESETMLINAIEVSISPNL